MTILIVTLLTLYSCITDNNSLNTRNRAINNSFKGDEKSDWLESLETIRLTARYDDLYILIPLLFDDKYDDINSEISTLISELFYLFNYDSSFFLEFVNSSDESLAICSFINYLDYNDIISFSRDVYGSSLDFRSNLIEDLGRNTLNYERILDLYLLGDKVSKVGAIHSAAYINDENIINWLIDRLYEDDNEISSAAVFSLSKKGSVGFSKLAQNLVFLSNRLKLIVVDLLSFNKVEEAYSYYSRLLINPNDLITDRVITSYKNLGVKAVDYIIDALIIGHPGTKLKLLELLYDIPGLDYLNRLTFLLEYTYMQEALIEFFYSKSAYGIIEELLLRNDYGVDSKIFDYGVEHRYEFLVKNKSLESFTINYFLNNYALDDVVLYFNELGLEQNYVEDYENIVDVYNSIEKIEAFGKLNGEVDFITRYFELEQQVSISNKENKLFYDNMQNWLETGDDSFLEDSLILKNSDKPYTMSIEDEKKSFVESLSVDDRELITEYETALRSIKTDYRKVTFRLKDFTKNMIFQRGYSYLIN